MQVCSYEDGVMRVISQQTRSQVENKEPAVERFVELLRDALQQVPIRKKTRVFNDNYLFRTTTIKIPGQRQLFFPSNDN